MWPKDLVIVTGKKKDEQVPYGDITMVTKELLIPKTNCAKYGPQ
jgi:hypothetical protein